MCSALLLFHGFNVFPLPEKSQYSGETNEVEYVAMSLLQGDPAIKALLTRNQVGWEQQLIKRPYLPRLSFVRNLIEAMTDAAYPYTKRRRNQLQSLSGAKFKLCDVRSFLARPLCLNKEKRALLSSVDDDELVNWLFECYQAAFASRSFEFAKFVIPSWPIAAIQITFFSFRSESFSRRKITFLYSKNFSLHLKLSQFSGNS